MSNQTNRTIAFVIFPHRHLTLKSASSFPRSFSSETPLEYVLGWRWNEVRYPTRSALPLLTSIIIKDANKSDEALKKQVSEYNEVRQLYTAIERKDQGTLLVKPLGPYVKKQPIETTYMTTLMVVVPKSRQQEFLDTYETLEEAAAIREAEEAVRKQAEAEERSRKEAERRLALEEKEAELEKEKTPAQLAAEAARRAEKEAADAKAAEAKRLEAELADPVALAQAEEERRAREEEEKRANKKLPRGCNAVVPRSATLLADEAEFVLFSIVALKQGAEHYKNLLREKRYTLRPFKYDPEEDKAERERKIELGKKKKNLWNFLIRWCTTTYVEVFTAWVHLKAIRLYVESVLRYGLPYNCSAMILEPSKGKEKQLRDVLKQLYAKLAGNNANLTTALDPNEPDLSGLGSDFYSYVYLPLNLND